MTSAIAGTTGSQSPISGPATPNCPIHSTLPASTTRRPRIAAEFSGFYEILGAAADSNHPTHAEAKEWLDDHDLNVFDEQPIKYALSRIANQRNAAKARLSKQKPSRTARTTEPALRPMDVHHALQRELSFARSIASPIAESCLPGSQEAVDQP